MCLLLNSYVFSETVNAETKTIGQKTVEGAPTQKMWTFEANKCGTYKIEFTYSRPWEKTASDRTVQYTVKVTDEYCTDAEIVALAVDKENTIKKGQKFTVTLEENASTGYSWSYNIEANPIKLTKVETIDGMVGTLTQNIWTFTAKKSGTYKIKFIYSQPWKDNTSGKTVEYTIKVSKKNDKKAETINLVADKVNTVNKGQKFTVILQQNISTGYSWNYTANNKIIKLYKQETTDNLLGAQTQKTWTFMANKSGTYKIKFTYSRPWEKTNSDKNVEYTVKVANENSSDLTTVMLITDKENIVKIGQSFTIDLEENGSTGYSWNYNIEANAISLIE